MIYGKDKTTRKDAQAAIDFLDKINKVEDNDEGMYEDLDSPKTVDNESSTKSYVKGNKAASSAKANKKRKINETCDLLDMAKELGDRFQSSLSNLSTNFGIEAMVTQKYEFLFEELSKIEGLTENEVMIASRKIIKDVRDMLMLFSIPAHQKLKWSRGYLNGK